MILHMTEILPQNRPSAQDIIDKYLPVWAEQINNDIQQFESSPDEQSSEFPLSSDPQDYDFSRDRSDSTQTIRAEVAHKLQIKK